MPVLLSLWRAATAWLLKPDPAPVRASEEARRRALRAVTLEQLRESGWPCHPHF
jgi:hypothetical protein